MPVFESDQLEYARGTTSRSAYDNRASRPPKPIFEDKPEVGQKSL